jgi:outer membrane protein OmpA-like peptidoglycan-associated protein
VVLGFLWVSGANAQHAIDIRSGFAQAVLAPNGQPWAIGPIFGGGLNFQASENWQIRLGLEWHRLWNDTASSSVVKWPDPDRNASRAWTSTSFAVRAQRRVGILDPLAPYVGLGAAWTKWSVASYPDYGDVMITNEDGQLDEYSANEFTLLGTVGIEPYVYKGTRLRLEGGIDLLTGIGTDFSQEVNDERSHAQLVLRVGLVVPLPRTSRPTVPLEPSLRQKLAKKVSGEQSRETDMPADTAESHTTSKWETVHGPLPSSYSRVEAIVRGDSVRAEQELLAPQPDTLAAIDTAEVVSPASEFVPADTILPPEVVDTAASEPVVAEEAEYPEPVAEDYWDTDQDGVADSIDQCPSTPFGARVTASGCPTDEDQDGVYDGLDHCPGTPRVVRMVVDAAGCPVDSDNDGVPDYLDYCPETPNGISVTERGCPPDGDGDGIPNYRDQCRDTPKGLEVDETGCLVMTQLTRRLVLHVSYLPGTTDPDRLSLRILDDLASRLKRASEISAVVEGFTDNIGLDSANQFVSQKRADKIKEYLISRGISPDRIESYGRGETDFIADNATAAGRQKNRRIEISFHRAD